MPSAASTRSPPFPSPRRTNSAARGATADPIGTHLAAPLDDVVRIFSTSGTTGAPSYIPLTARDLDDWTSISAAQLFRLGHPRAATA